MDLKARINELKAAITMRRAANWSRQLTRIRD
jgi:hypothetical protein